MAGCRTDRRLWKSCPLIKLILFGPGVDFFVFSQKASQQGLQKSQHTLRTERVRHPTNTTSQQEITRWYYLSRSLSIEHSMRWSARDRNVSYRVSFSRPRLHQIWQKYSRIIICINWEISSLSTWTMSSRAPVCAPLSAPATPPGLYLRVWYLFSLKHSKIPKY